MNEETRMISLNPEVSLFVTNLDNEGPLLRLWAQIDKEGGLRVERLLQPLTMQFDNGRGAVKNRSALAPNTICCAMFERAYYRARILSYHSAGGILVQFIDYGNIELLQESDVRLIDDIPDALELRTIPPLAIHYIVADALPINNAIEWDTHTLMNILKNIRYNTYPGKVISIYKSSRFLRMIFNGQNFADVLVAQQLARHATPEEMIRVHAMIHQAPMQPSQPAMHISQQATNQIYENSSNNYARQQSRIPRGQNHAENWRVQAQTNIPAPRVQVDNACVFRTRFLEIGTQNNVTVSYVEDGPLMFSVQVNSTAEELTNLMRHINSLEPTLLTEAPVSGTVCLGRYSFDKTLMRAVITQVRKDECKLHYVDFGNFEVLPHTEIYVLPRQFINPRCLSIRVTMSNVNDLIITDELKQYFKTYVTGKNLVLDVKSPEERSLIQCGDLYDNGHNVKDILRSIFGSSRWLPPVTLVENSKVIVQVVHVDKSIAWIQLDSEAALLNKLACHIEQSENAPMFKPGQLKKGLHCVALSSTDSQWYRAEIVESAGNDVKVFYVDYGNEETIPITSIRQIRDKMITQLRAQAIRCIINDYEKEITTMKLHEILEAEISSKSIAMTVNRVTPAGPVVDFFDCDSEPLVNIIKKLKYASLVNGNISARLEVYRNPITNNSNINQRFSIKKPVGQQQKTKSQNVKSPREDQSNKWNRSESSRITESNNLKEDESDPRRFDNRYHTRDTDWPPNNSQQQNERFSRNEGKSFGSRDSPRYDRNDRGDTSGNSRGGRKNHDRGGRAGNFGNSRYNGNNSRNERNGSAEKTWSDKDSDTSSRGSGRSGRSGRRGNTGGRGNSNGSGNRDRANFKNSRSNGTSPRTRDNKRDFGDKNENQQFDTWTSQPQVSSPRFVIPGPNITTGAVKKCELVYMSSPTDFYLQLCPDNLDLDPIMTSIMSIYEHGGKILDRSSIVPGLDCVAKYSEDNIWYRANVLSVETNGAKVRFVDYGNTETVDFDKIKELDENIAKLWTQAIACKLLAAHKTTWDSSEIEKFGNLVDGKSLEAEFVSEENHVYEILLREIVDGKPSTVFVNEQFNNGADIAEVKNQARAKNCGPAPKNLVPLPDYASLDQKWLVEEISPGSKHNVIITWFVNPDNFYSQSLERKDEFRAMMNEIQQVYASRQSVTEPLQIGSPVLAVFSDDGALYRAEILELNKSRGSIVRYIDFGNTAMVEQRNIYRVEKKFMRIPKQAVNCSLKNIVPGNGGSWTKSNKQEIEKCFDPDNFECTYHELKDGKYTISLKNGDVDIAGLLVDKGLASFAVSGPVETIKNELDTTPQPEIEELPRFDISLLAGQILRVKVSSVASAAKFHIQLPSANASDKVIDSYMAKNNPKMLALPGELSVMQNQAVECCLKNATTSIVLDEKLRDRIENTNVIIAVEEVDNNRLIVKLYDTNGVRIKIEESDEDEKISPICPTPILYSTQKVGVTHVEHSSSVWLKRMDDIEMDTELLSQLYDYYSIERETKNFTPVPGALCAAKSPDGNWYRAKILDPTSTGGATVQYIDYGNSEEIDIASIRNLEPEFLVQPRLAIEVSLTVKLGGTIEQQREILNREILNREFIATMYNVRKNWVVELSNADGKLSEKLSNLEIVEVSKNPEVQTDIAEMAVGKRYKVTCTAVDSPASFWLQRDEEMAAIEELQNRLQIDAETCPILSGIPEEKTLCLAMYSMDSMWYRAEVIDADEDITTIQFVDFGNTDIVDTNQGKCKKITDSLRSIKRYATRCRLDVIPCGCEDWSSSACECFEGMATSLENMEALVIADSSPKRVDLLVDEKSLTDELVRKNYAMKICDEDDLIEEIVEREVDPRAAYVCHAVSPSEFWIQQEKYVGDLEILADRCIVADMFPKISKIVEGSLCVAKFPEDQEWYRAKILAHTDKGTEVIYIDYGNSAVSTEIREIPEDLAAQPAFSKKCRLLLPKGMEQWSEEACQEFVKIAADGATVFQLDVIEESEDTSVVRLTQDGRDIVEILMESAKLPIIEERLPPLGEENSPNVLISHVNSPADFYTQAESAICELESMAELLAAAESFLPLDNVLEGAICAAKFPEDEQWYRAKVLSHGDTGTEVLYVDYGNSAVTTELRVLPEDIVNIPPLSTSCSLLMPDHVESWSKEACERFLEIAAAGVTMFQYEILHENEQTVIRLSLDGRDIVETLAPLCVKKTNLGAPRNVPENADDTSCDTVVKEIVDGVVNLEIAEGKSTIDRGDASNEKISSVDTSGIEVTNSDASTNGISNSEISNDNDTTRVSESINREDIAKIVNPSDDTTIINEEVNIDKVIENNNNRIIADKETASDKIDMRNVENGAKMAETPVIEKIVESVDGQNSSTNKDEILSSINKADLNVRECESVRSLDFENEFTLESTKTDEEHSPLLARKLSFDEKIVPGSGSSDDSSKLEIPTSPKTPHSEKIVAGVVTLHEKFEDSENEEILTVDGKNNIPE